MKLRLRLFSDNAGAAVVEMAFALPVLIVMIWAGVGAVQPVVPGLRHKVA